jgi:aerobic-type carbon monoxide dehydrogenase small subunit (CoxS/CutS family)
MAFTLHVNGAERVVDVPAHWTLLRTLREALGLMGPREACGIGMCGSCTVLLDGRAVSSCLLLTPQAAGHHILTVEGLAGPAGLHPAQQAFLDHGAFQCSFCTPGFLMASIALLAENPHPSDDDIREHLAGNWCRCGSYPEILNAVRDLAGRRPPANMTDAR